MAKGRIKTYNPKEVIVSFGSHMAGGFNEDSFISIEATGDGITRKVGCDGEIARAISPDDTFILKAAFLQTSQSISWLQARYNYDAETGEGMFPGLIKDLKGGMVFSTDAAWVVKSAPRQFGRDTNTREFEIHTASGTLTE